MFSDMNVSQTIACFLCMKIYNYNLLLLCIKIRNFFFQYTPEEIEWYGLSWYEALSKLAKQKEAASRPVPLKNMYRKNLVEKLKAAGIEGTKSSPDEIS